MVQQKQRYIQETSDGWKACLHGDVSWHMNFRLVHFDSHAISCRDVRTGRTG